MPAAVIPDAWKTVRATPAGLPASALQYFHELLALHDAAGPWDAALEQAVGEPPLEDRPPINARKRKSGAQ